MNSSTDAEARTIRQSAQLIKDGTLASEQLVTECLNQIDTTDENIGAWAHLDREHALNQARNLDEIRRKGQPLGDLHGIPIGIKDIFDTADSPTELGSTIHAGRRPEADSAVVEKLREAGAVVLGKTVTTEFAYMHPAETRNPHNPAYSPGGSSSGSAAAVAAGHVPLSIGSQTNGSTIRPASYCGIYGFKPTRGIISRRGVLQTSATLDQVGVFGLDPGDLALLCDVLGGYDATDSMSYLAPRPRVLDGYLSEVPIEPNFAWIDIPYSDRFSNAILSGSEELAQVLGSQFERIPAPQTFSALPECHKIIHDYEIYRCLEREREDHWGQLSETMQRALKAAAKRTDAQYEDALSVLEGADTWFQQFFYDYDAIITPSATGEPPKMGNGTGDPICSTIWTLCGLPCVSLPLLTGDNGLPIGIQLVAGVNEDDRLLRTTRWLLDRLRSSIDN